MGDLVGGLFGSEDKTTSSGDKTIKSSPWEPTSDILKNIVNKAGEL